MVYLRWRRALPSWLEVLPLEYPGRGARYDEPFARDIPALADRLADDIEAGATGSNQPYAIFGHSLGALVAFELTHRLAERGAEPPSALMVSGAEAPSCRDAAVHAEPRTDEALLALLRKLGGTADAALENAELMAMVLPVMRADLLLCGRYQPAQRTPLTCRLQVFGGWQDSPSVASLRAWQRETSAGFSVDMLDGHHFFIHQQEARLLQCIQAVLHPELQTS